MHRKEKVLIPNNNKVFWRNARGDSQARRKKCYLYGESAEWHQYCICILLVMMFLVIIDYSLQILFVSNLAIDYGDKLG